MTTRRIGSEPAYLKSFRRKFGSMRVRAFVTTPPPTPDVDRQPAKGPKKKGGRA